MGCLCELIALILGLLVGDLGNRSEIAMMVVIARVLGIEFEMFFPQGRGAK